MDANNKSFFWGVLLGAAAAAIAGAVALSLSFRDASASPGLPAQGARAGKKRKRPAATAKKRKK